LRHVYDWVWAATFPTSTTLPATHGIYPKYTDSPGGPQAASTRGVVIDLSGATFLDSSGIALLVGCRQVAEEAAVPYAAIKVNGRVLDVLDLTGVLPFRDADPPDATPRLQPNRSHSS
jgi:hypothetical protein